ncbi:hypothetical protein HOS59_gp17 [Streptomyces phage Rowa]|uniref:Uncharacterized protein n=1 Tax=Streptomyces phage Rowa TaxID=2059883 RepID=A0A2H5BLX0_9CAUD|nr:hypothetical protein HOS59_gp17 [Streptomyces phage Rowa]AUG87281.1 hypothetical protein SEA_ROWA_17 [Streptomyces phage Rowa]
MAYGNPNLLPTDASTFEGGTSSWAATGTNCTSIAQNGFRLSGTWSLQVTATAAGSASVWGPRVAVTAGSEYVARPMIGIGVSQTGLTCYSTIEWWTAATGGTKVSETVGPQWAISSTVGFWSANAPVAIGTAPAGATHALLKVSVNNLAASGRFFIDDVYFGVAWQTKPGNIYGFNTSSVEADTSGWKIDSGTMARGNWNLFGGAGFYGLEWRSAAAGTGEIRTNNFIGVTPGTEYVSWANVLAPAVATTWYMEFRWYDSGWNEVGSRSQSTYSLAANEIRRIGATGQAPAGSVYTKVFIRPVATAADQVFVIDDAILLVAPNVAGNLLTYNEFSSEANLPAWTVTNGTATQGYLTSGITDGFWTLRLDPTELGGGIVQAQLDRLIPVTPGTTYMVKATGYRHNTSSAQSIPSSMRVRVDWFDANGDLFQADNPDQFYGRDASGEWYAHVNSETRTCPEGAVYAKFGIEADCSSALLDRWHFDNIHMVEAVSEYVLVTDNALGMVSLTINNVYPTATAVSIERVDEDGKKYPLRGFGRVYDKAPYTAGVLQVEDYEAPLAATIWYAITWWVGTSMGARLYTQTISAPILADADFVWFKAPGIPALNTTVTMEAPLKWSRTARSARYDVVGRKNPVHVTSTRAGRQSSLTVLIWDPQANALFDSLLDAGTAALIQAMPGYGIDGNLYVSIGDVDCEPLDPDAREPGWRWTLAITEVDRPDGGLQGSASDTWEDIYLNAAYTSWDDLFDTHSTWADVLLKG